MANVTATQTFTPVLYSSNNFMLLYWDMSILCYYSHLLNYISQWNYTNFLYYIYLTVVVTMFTLQFEDPNHINIDYIYNIDYDTLLNIKLPNSI